MVQSLRSNRNCKIDEIIWYSLFLWKSLVLLLMDNMHLGGGFYLNYSDWLVLVSLWKNTCHLLLYETFIRTWYIIQVFSVKALNSIFLTPNQRVNISWFLSLKDLWVRTSKIKISRVGRCPTEGEFISCINLIASKKFTSISGFQNLSGAVIMKLTDMLSIKLFLIRHNSWVIIVSGFDACIDINCTNFRQD